MEPSDSLPSISSTTEAMAAARGIHIIAVHGPVLDKLGFSFAERANRSAEQRLNRTISALSSMERKGGQKYFKQKQQLQDGLGRLQKIQVCRKREILKKNLSAGDLLEPLTESLNESLQSDETRKLEGEFTENGEVRVDINKGYDQSIVSNEVETKIPEDNLTNLSGDSESYVPQKASEESMENVSDTGSFSTANVARPTRYIRDRHPSKKLKWSLTAPVLRVTRPSTSQAAFMTRRDSGVTENALPSIPNSPYAVTSPNESINSTSSPRSDRQETVFRYDRQLSQVSGFVRKDMYVTRDEYNTQAAQLGVNGCDKDEGLMRVENDDEMYGEASTYNDTTDGSHGRGRKADMPFTENAMTPMNVSHVNESKVDLKRSPSRLGDMFAARSKNIHRNKEELLRVRKLRPVVHGRVLSSNDGVHRVPQNANAGRGLIQSSYEEFRDLEKEFNTVLSNHEAQHHASVHEEESRISNQNAFLPRLRTEPQQSIRDTLFGVHGDAISGCGSVPGEETHLEKFISGLIKRGWRRLGREWVPPEKEELLAIFAEERRELQRRINNFLAKAVPK